MAPSKKKKVGRSRQKPQKEESPPLFVPELPKIEVTGPTPKSSPLSSPLFLLEDDEVDGPPSSPSPSTLMPPPPRPLKANPVEPLGSTSAPLMASEASSSAAPEQCSNAQADNIPDETSYQFGEHKWDLEHPPVLFGMLDPPQRIRSLKDIPAPFIRTADGRKEMGADGQPLRDLPMLPRFIGSDNDPLPLEYYFRADPRVGYNDIRARQLKWKGHEKFEGTPGRGRNNPLRRPNNTINNARRRMVREPLKMRDWSVKHEGRGSKIFIKLLDGLTQEQIDHNTTWVVTRNGIHPPTNLHFIFPHFAFLDNGKYPHQVSQETQRALDVLQKVRQLAIDHGLDSWEKLPKDVLPDSWYKPKRLGKGRQPLADDDEDEAEVDESDVSAGTKRPQKKRVVEGIVRSRTSGGLLGNTKPRVIAPRQTTGEPSVPTDNQGNQKTAIKRVPRRDQREVGPGGLLWYPDQALLVHDLNIIDIYSLNTVMVAAQSWKEGRARRGQAYAGEAYRIETLTVPQIHLAMDIAVLDQAQWGYCAAIYNQRVEAYHNANADRPPTAEQNSLVRFGAVRHGVHQASQRLQDATMNPILRPGSVLQSYYGGHLVHHNGNQILVPQQAYGQGQMSYVAQPQQYGQTMHRGPPINPPYSYQMPIQMPNQFAGNDYVRQAYQQQVQYPELAQMHSNGRTVRQSPVHQEQHIAHESSQRAPEAHNQSLTQAVAPQTQQHTMTQAHSGNQQRGQNTSLSAQIHPFPVPRRPTNWQLSQRSTPIPILPSSGYAPWFANPRPIRSIRRSLPNPRLQSISPSDHEESPSGTEGNERSIVEAAARRMVQMSQNAAAAASHEGSRSASDAQLMPPPPLPSNASAQQIVQGDEDVPMENAGSEADAEGEAENANVPAQSLEMPEDSLDAQHDVIE